MVRTDFPLHLQTQLCVGRRWSLVFKLVTPYNYLALYIPAFCLFFMSLAQCKILVDY